MKNKIIDNLYELWNHIGTQNHCLNTTAEYSYVKPNNDSWPTKLFEIKESEVNFKKLFQQIENGTLPNAIAIPENERLEKQLLKHDFQLKYTVKAMYLNLQQIDKPANDFSSIERVNNQVKAIEFARIASSSFNYPVLVSVISSLINSDQLKLYIGKYGTKYVSCGLVLLDKNGISGLHMIGTLSDYRGHGLGKVMTNKLLLEAFENGSQQVVLVASKSGERIYSKLGFVA